MPTNHVKTADGRATLCGGEVSREDLSATDAVGYYCNDDLGKRIGCSPCYDGVRRHVHRA